ncbi:YggU family protein [bacterium]|nr:YggU family protein [bacterium]
MGNQTQYTCISQKGNDVVLLIRLTPNSSKNEFCEITDEFLKVKVTAQPIENKANKELIKFLSDSFNIPKTRLELMSGDKSKLKRILIKDTNKEEILSKILFMLK